MSLKDQIKHQVLNDPRNKKHKIFFVSLDGETRSVETSGIVTVGDHFLEWRDLNGVFHWTVFENLAEIYFDEIHRDMVEEKMKNDAS